MSHNYCRRSVPVIEKRNSRLFSETVAGNRNSRRRRRRRSRRRRRRGNKGYRALLARVSALASRPIQCRFDYR